MPDNQQSEQAKSKRIELILQQLNMLPTLPAVAARLLQVTVRSNSQASEVVALIESDASLASKIMMMVTRGGTGLKRQAVSVSKAVVLLGFDAVRNAVLSIKVFETLCDRESGARAGVDPTGLWKHSLAVACAAKMLAENIDRRIDAEEAFLCGLLHNMGKLALLAALPKSYARVIQITETSLADITDIEQRVLGVDHCIAGKRLAQRWELPSSVIETAWLYQQGLGTLPAAVQNRRLIEIVHVAEALCRQQRLGYSGNHSGVDDIAAMAEHIGCGRSCLEKISQELCNEISERASLVGLDDMQPVSLYHEALAEANSELGRLNMRLQTQNRQLQIRSQYFELLNQLNQGLQRCRTVQNVCDLIAGIWQGHVSGTCAIFAAADDAKIVEGVFRQSSNEAASFFVIDNEEDSRHFLEMMSNNSAGFTIRACNPEDAILFDVVRPDFPIEQAMAMPLVSGSQTVGMMFWTENAQPDDYASQIKEMQGFAADAALAIMQSQRTEQQSLLCEQLAQVNFKLRQSQKELSLKQSMASVGEMACGAAHEMNNPLAVIVGRAQLLSSSEEDPKRKKMLDAISERGAELSDIISDLLTFARPAVPNPKPLNIEDLVNCWIADRQDTAKAAMVTIVSNIDESLPQIFADRVQLIDVGRELLNNAIDSFGSEPGEIDISANYNEWDNTIVLMVADHGCGMDGKTLSKACDPFFSAKRAGRKRGLGLSRSSQLIGCNGGQLSITSELGKGTVVRLVLPAYDEENEEAPEES